MLNDTASTRRFIREALPLLSSYFYSEQVQLEPYAVEVGQEESEEYVRFARTLRMRHAIACAIKLKPILTAIERGASHVSEVIRSESKGAIFGRLDIPLYLSRRSNNVSWPRTLPILLTRDSPSTPENQLVVDRLRQVVRRLDELATPSPSSEKNYSLNLLAWSREKLRSEPWMRSKPSRNGDRLRRETEHRIRKRQTGNESAYLQLLDWCDQWQFDPSHADAELTETLVDLLLAFPPGDFFEDRVFEIWCLHQVIESFRRVGAVAVQGPHALSQRSGRAICEMTYDGYRFEIWFQRSLPNAMARWQYLRTGQSLAGIPDITVLGDNGRRLFVDAKRREVRTNTRPEETYKMLGYLENFRQLFDPSPFWAALCFISENDLFTELVTDRQDKLVLIGAHPNDPGVCAMGGRMDTLVAEWLAQGLGR